MLEVFCQVLTKEINLLEEKKYDDTVDADTILELEKRISARYLFLAGVLRTYPALERECLLTSFSMNPTEESFGLICMVGDKFSKNADTNEEPEEIDALHAITSSDVLLKSKSYDATKAPNRILDSLTDFSENVRADVASLLTVPRIKSLTWLTPWQQLKENCKNLLENDKKKKIVEKCTAMANGQLKYINDNLNYDEFKDFTPHEYPGIQKGYEVYVADESSSADSSSAESDETLSAPESKEYIGKERRRMQERKRRLIRRSKQILAQADNNKIKIEKFDANDTASTSTTVINTNAKDGKRKRVRKQGDTTGDGTKPKRQRKQKLNKSNTINDQPQTIDAITSNDRPMLLNMVIEPVVDNLVENNSFIKTEPFDNSSTTIDAVNQVADYSIDSDSNSKINNNGNFLQPMLNTNDPDDHLTSNISLDVVKKEDEIAQSDSERDTIIATISHSLKIVNQSDEFSYNNEDIKLEEMQAMDAMDIETIDETPPNEQNIVPSFISEAIIETSGNIESIESNQSCSNVIMKIDVQVGRFHGNPMNDNSRNLDTDHINSDAKNFPIDEKIKTEHESYSSLISHNYTQKNCCYPSSSFPLVTTFSAPVTVNQNCLHDSIAEKSIVESIKQEQYINVISDNRLTLPSSVGTENQNCLASKPKNPLLAFRKPRKSIPMISKSDALQTQQGSQPAVNTNNSSPIPISPSWPSNITKSYHNFNFNNSFDNNSFDSMKSDEIVQCNAFLNKSTVILSTTTISSATIPGTMEVTEAAATSAEASVNAQSMYKTTNTLGLTSDQKPNGPKILTKHCMVVLERIDPNKRLQLCVLDNSQLNPNVVDDDDDTKSNSIYGETVQIDNSNCDDNNSTNKLSSDEEPQQIRKEQDQPNQLPENNFLDETMQPIVLLKNLNDIQPYRQSNEANAFKQTIDHQANANENAKSMLSTHKNGIDQSNDENCSSNGQNTVRLDNTSDTDKLKNNTNDSGDALDDEEDEDEEQQRKNLITLTYSSINNNQNGHHNNDDDDDEGYKGSEETKSNCLSEPISFNGSEKCNGQEQQQKQQKQQQQQQSDQHDAIKDKNTNCNIAAENNITHLVNKQIIK